jgi:hypothetical protein
MFSSRYGLEVEVESNSAVTVKWKVHWSAVFLRENGHKLEAPRYTHGRIA